VSELVGLLGLALAVVTVVVVMMLLVGGRTEDSGNPPAAAPRADVQASRATVSLGPGGEVTSASISFTTTSRALHLSVPSRTGLAAGFEPRVEDVRVIADGRTVATVPTMGAGDTRTVMLPEGASKIRLEYSGTGTFRRTGPVAEGRGLTLLTPLVVAEGETHGVALTVDDRAVLNVGCLAGDEMTTCGTTTPKGWVVETGAGHADVVAQVDLTN